MRLCRIRASDWCILCFCAELRLLDCDFVWFCGELGFFTGGLSRFCADLGFWIFLKLCQVSLLIGGFAGFYFFQI